MPVKIIHESSAKAAILRRGFTTEDYNFQKQKNVTTGGHTKGYLLVTSTFAYVSVECEVALSCLSR